MDGGIKGGRTRPGNSTRTPRTSLGPSAWLFRVPCMVLRALCCLPVYPPFLRSSKQTQNPFSPTHTDKLTRAVPQGQRLTRNNNKQTEKQAGWRKSGRWRVRYVKGEKWNNGWQDPGGGRKFFCLSRGREKKNDWCKEQKIRKDRITYVDNVDKLTYRVR